MTMTREEQIKKAADKFQREFMPKDKNNERFCFISGILWADKHPQSSWISADERLPEKYMGLIKSEEKLVKLNEYAIRIAVYHFGGKQWIDAFTREVITPIAWMTISELPRNVE